MAEAFKAAGNDVKFEIAAEGSSTAFPALANGTAQIGMSSRKAKDDEITFCKTKGVFLKQHKACYDMMAVIVNKNNPIADLSEAQVAKLFTGGVKDWSEVGGRPGADFGLHPEHLVRHLQGLAEAGHGWPRLRLELPEDGGQRADRGRSLQEPERRRLCRPRLHQQAGHQGRHHRRHGADGGEREEIPVFPPVLLLRAGQA